MEISIITINYNNCEGLRRTIESVVNQTCRDFEYIIIDGGSTDGSVDVIKCYADNIDHWVSEPDGGIYNAMNKGVAVAKGEYCLFMNSGDCLYNDSVICDVLSQGLDADVVAGSVVCIDGEINESPKNITFDTFYFGGWVNHEASFIKKEIMIRFPYDENYRIVSDWKFFIEAIVLNNATYKQIDRVVCLYDLTGISTVNTELRTKEKEQVFKELIPDRIMNDYDKFHGKNDDFHRLMFTLTQMKARKAIYSVIVFLLKIIMLNRGWVKTFPIKSRDL